MKKKKRRTRNGYRDLRILREFLRRNYVNVAIVVAIIV